MRIIVLVFKTDSACFSCRSAAIAVSFSVGHRVVASNPHLHGNVVTENRDESGSTRPVTALRCIIGGGGHFPLSAVVLSLDLSAKVDFKTIAQVPIKMN
jgi:hypothetical protein